MSDVSLTPAPAPDTPAPSDSPVGTEPVPAEDPEVVALLEKLGPALAELMSVVVDAKLASLAMPTVTPGRVTSYTVATHTALVLLDGDPAEVPVQVVSEPPIPGDRVAVLLVPPAAAFLLGIEGGSGLPAGSLVPYAGVVSAEFSTSTLPGPPRGHLWPFGQVYKQAAYPSLFAAIGTTYNTGGEAGDEFRMPDMRGRGFVGLDNMGGSDAGRLSSANTLGATGGAESHTISGSNLPSHTHGFTPAGSVSVSLSGLSTDSQGSHTHSDSGHAHGFTAWANGSSQVRNDAAGWSADSQSLSTGYASANLDYQGSHSHNVSGSGSGSFSGSGGTTDGGPGSSTAVNHMNPFLTGNWLIKA